MPLILFIKDYVTLCKIRCFGFYYLILRDFQRLFIPKYLSSVLNINKIEMVYLGLVMGISVNEAYN